jgi:hypothetical protein
MREKVFSTIIRYKKPILIVYLVLAILSAIGIFFVGVNYDIIEYLPDEAPSTEAIDLMSEEFSEEDEQLRIMVEDIGVTEALDKKDAFEEVDHVLNVEWLDDVEDMEDPLPLMNQKNLENHYVDGNALYVLTLDVDEEDIDKRDETIETLRDMMGDNASMSGDLLQDYERDQNTLPDLGWSLTLSLIVAIIVLGLSTTSWISPFLILGVIAIAIIINMGTNIFLGEISFVTRDAAAILQLAVSVDFSLFLFHRYEEMREKEKDKETAMTRAMTESFKPVISSGLTEILGFGALVFMDYGIGQDMGIVLVKGVIISLVSVFLLLPSVTLLGDKLVHKTAHSSLVPSLKPLARGIFKLRYVSVTLLLLLVVPMFLAGENNDFLYGETGWLPDDNYVSIEEERIEEYFARDNQMVMMVPRDRHAEEHEIVQQLNELAYVSEVDSFVEETYFAIPSSLLPENEREDIESENYRRFIISTQLPIESDETFDAVEEIREIAADSLGEGYYLTGESPSTYDLKDVITDDQQIVNMVSVVSILLVLLIVYRSLSLPVFLVFCIQAAIFINLGIPYFTGQTLYYIGYLILHSIQLGSTVDYATLLSDRYLDERKDKDKKEALFSSIEKAGVSILTASTIMISSSLIFGLLSTSEVTAQIGILLSRGSALSLMVVLLVLPTLLFTFDGLIQKTSWKLDLK